VTRADQLAVSIKRLGEPDDLGPERGKQAPNLENERVDIEAPALNFGAARDDIIAPVGVLFGGSMRKCAAHG
jgi:hypothetical protein